MAVTEKSILNRLYFVAGIMFVFAIAVVVKLFTIQFVQGDKYRALAQERTIKNVVIPANRGNVYAADGSLLATSIPKYDLRFDALTPTTTTFEKYLKPLSDSLSKYSGKSSTYYQNELRKARANKNRYFLVARNINYTDYTRIRNFPLYLESESLNGFRYFSKVVVVGVNASKRRSYLGIEVAKRLPSAA